jgi:dienelactone hydrolase
MLPIALAALGGEPVNTHISDKRFELVRDVNTPVDVSYLAKRYKTAREWRKRAAELREQVLASAGLLPMPEKCPLNARVFGRIDRGDYTVEKVYFESWPGFYVTGNLYRPTGKGPFPAVLNPHGHWEHGRLENSDSCSVPGRCINFAKQGYIAFSHDMVGYNDSRQVAHRGDSFADRLCRLYGISLGGLQLWNSIRALDFLESLPDVDSERIACTGASGGGTQTFLLCAVDDRVKVAAPVNMISHTMQGGCRCENLPGLRIDTDNVEIGALMAPRPLLMVSATGDWTKETPEVEFPAIRSIYRLLGAEDRIECVRIDAAHNYNKDSREAVYSFFGKWLPNKPLAQPVKEQPFEVERNEDLLVFPGGELPDGDAKRDELVKRLIAASERQLEEHRPNDERSLRRFKSIYGPALRRSLSVPALVVPDGASVSTEEPANGMSAREARLVVREYAHGGNIPALMRGKPDSKGGKLAIVVSDSGLSSLPALADGLVGKGWGMCQVDCFGIGAHSAPDGSSARDFDTAFFDTYNRTDIAERVLDIVSVVEWACASPRTGGIALLGTGEAGLWCLLAAAFAPDVDSVVVDACGLDLSADDALTSDLFAPLLRRAGDFRAAMALFAPRRLFIHNTQARFDASWAEAAYGAAGKPGALRVEKNLAAGTEIVRWLNDQPNR